ncbi:TPA: tRNA (guanosine(37)-N1)-methyltransferase TrmD [Candidatus Nomurabacteria bacterium]|nr:tRNA (guanosine(37)-N1)-methyltransferase TrmD [Candidatus Nomurabacteria bacterium]
MKTQPTRYHVVTIFPDMFDSYFAESIISRAIENKLIEVNTYSLREYTVDKHRRVDGKPYGGGPGMVMWVDSIIRCVEKIQKNIDTRYKKQALKNLKTGNLKLETGNCLIVIFNAGGQMFTNTIAKNTAKKYTDIIFICGRYEGIDDRVKKILKAKEWSIGQYVLTGGELPAMVCIDAISRQIKGVLNDELSLEENRIASHEIYARPEIYEYNGKKYRVPKVLLSGNHKLINEYRAKKENTIGKKVISH